MITLTTEQAQQIEEALEDIVRVFKFETGTPVEALAAIRAARAQEQAEQEPVAFIGHGLLPIVPEDLEKLRKYEPGMATLYDTPLYAAPQPVQQGPVAEVNWLGASDVKWIGGMMLPQGTKLYTAPVRTKDLTPDEILEITKRFALGIAFPVDGVTTPEMFARAVIAAYKEKNK